MTPSADGEDALHSVADGNATSAIKVLNKTSTGSSASTSSTAPSSNIDGTAPTTKVPAESPSMPDLPAQSQPMTTSKSTSSNASTKETKDTTMATAAAPYGTRSRGTRNVARPNYAEDADLMDFELTQPAQNGTAPESNLKSSGNSVAHDSPPPASRKGIAAANGAGTSANDAPKDAPISGTSSSTTITAAAPAPAPTKRRKAQANQAATNGAHASSGTQASSRRAAQQAATAHPSRQSNMYSFESSKARLKNGKLEADDGTVFNVNDCVYLICEPPGEPYYLCRLMEFVRDDSNDPNSPIVSIRVNWFYRPRDVQRFNNDTRLVYGTMHSDICPLTSLRGKCQIKHRSEIGDVDEYRKIPDSFWFNQAFDRFIHRWYEVVPTKQVINVPEKVKKALDERWKYVVVETSRVKELTSEVKTCKRCTVYCANPDSVECAVCHNTYHMNCVRPPLLKKPSRGFAWACGPCSRAQERKLEARRTPIIGDPNQEAEEDEQMEEEEDEAGAKHNADTTAPSPNGSEPEPPADLHPATQAEIALAQMWPMRYLGIHARVEDALQYDDRAIYPRASSRLGPRHQANVNVWHGHAVEFVKPAEIKRRYVKAGGQKKDTKLSKETVAALEADRQEKAKRPKWVQDEPLGYVRRGEDLPNKDSKNSAKLMFRMPPQGVHSERGTDDAPSVKEADVDAYMQRAKNQVASIVGVEKWNTNFLDKALELYSNNNYNADAAIRQLKKVDRKKDLKEPELSKEEIKRFGEGVAKYGSELRSVRIHVKTITPGEAVRYYYIWKKREGKEIWKNYGGRKGRTKKPDSEVTAKLLDDVAHDQDDSAFDCEKAERRKRGFQCKFCNIRHSRQWRRAPNATPGQTVLADGRSKEKGQSLVVALCQRCANLWRRYAIKWENIDEIAKKIAMGGLKATKRRIDEELINEFNFAKNNPHAMDIDPHPLDHEAAPEPAKKKLKVSALDKDKDGHSSASESTGKKEKRTVFQIQQPPPPPPPPKQPTPPPVPAQPKMRILPCAVCWQWEIENDRLMTCNECKLTVHRKCFGIDSRRTDKWTCNMCRNDRKTQVSYTYECVLCPVTITDIDLVEAPKVSHKKKTDRDRERERMEKELAIKLGNDYRQQQRDRGRPELPREPLKRTSDGNWVHVYCAAWVPETKFNESKSLDVIEGIGSVALRYEQTCKVCKTEKGACVSCQQPGCNASFHVGCAHQAGYTFGFDVVPVKGSRRDVNHVVTIGAEKAETGALNAAIWCKEHSPKTIVHPITEIVSDTPNLTALQVYVRNYKEAESSTTGPARKAALMDQSVLTNSLSAANRRASAVQTTTASARGARRSSTGDGVKAEDEGHEQQLDRQCIKCNVEVTPKWWVANEKSLQKEPERVVRPVTANGIPPHDPSGKEPSTPGKPTLWMCNKCHWKKLNAVEETEERPPSRPEAIQPELPPRSMPIRSPTSIPYPAPAPWNQPGGAIPQPAPPLSSWAGNHPSTAPPLSNGITHSPRAHPVLPPHQPTYHAPAPMHQPLQPHQQHQPNGYLPPHVHPATVPPPYGAPHAPLAPMHAGIISNGHPSPHHLPMHSPTHPPPHQGFPPPSRHSGSPYLAGPPGPPQHLPPFGSHQSPPLPPAHLHHRPTTPRARDTLPPLQPPPQDRPSMDRPPMDRPPMDRPAMERAPASGASASPSLRNLLH